MWRGTARQLRYAHCCGWPQCLVLQLERITDVRYDSIDLIQKPLEAVHKLSRLIHTTKRLAGVPADGMLCKLCLVHGSLNAPDGALREMWRPLFTPYAKKLVIIDHHLAHATLGLYTSAFRRALIVSFDGGGNDGYFVAFTADMPRITRVRSYELNLGTFYSFLGPFMPPIAGAFNPANFSGWHDTASFPGKIMALAALGRAKPDWVERLVRVALDFNRHFMSKNSIRCAIDGCEFENLNAHFVRQLLGANVADLLPHAAVHASANTPNATARTLSLQLSDSEAHDLAASLQAAFERLATHLIAALSSEFPALPLVLSGGCALNVKLAARVCSTSSVPVHVPPDPSDGGLAAGAALAASPPSIRASSETRARDVAYLGPALEDGDQLQHAAEARGARRLGVHGLAAELAVHGRVVGVVRGRQEFGPRALGHRSLLAFPNEEAVKHKLNAIKHRQVYI